METQRATAAERSQSYWLLSRLFLEQPATALLTEIAAGLRASSGKEDRAELEILKRTTATALASARGLTDLQVEYTRLLGGASKQSGAPEPYESVAREGRLFGESAEAVTAAYAQAGYLEVLAKTGPPDHLGAELRFMALLCYDESLAWGRADEVNAEKLLQRELDFLDEHVLAWARPFCEALVEVAKHPFYMAVARLTATTCQEDREELASFFSRGM